MAEISSVHWHRVLLHIFNCMLSAVSMKLKFQFISHSFQISSHLYLFSHMDSKIFIRTHSFPNSKLQFGCIFAFLQAGRRCGFHRKAILNMHQAGISNMQVFLHCLKLLLIPSPDGKLTGATRYQTTSERNKQTFVRADISEARVFTWWKRRRRFGGCWKERGIYLGLRRVGGGFPH